MTRKVATVAVASALTLLLLGGAAKDASAQEVVPFVTVNEAPEGAGVAAGDHFQAAEMSDTRPLAQGSVGPLPVFFSDDEFGCQWSTAAASGMGEWIGVARRGEAGPEGLGPCAAFQAKVTAATAAGADALIVVNNAPGAEVGTAAGTIPAVMIDQNQGNLLIEALDPESPEAVQATLELLDPETFLPFGQVAPTEVTSLDASVSGGTLEVSGRALFRGEAPVIVGEDPEGDPPFHPELARFGLDATGLAIRQPNPLDPTLEFSIPLAELNFQPLPEAIRYLWQFSVGGEEFWIQAKTSDVSTVTAFSDDPQGSLTHIPGSFRLRGNCGEVGLVATCVHLAWLDGVFDTGRNEVRINLPLDLFAAPEITRGASIDPEDGMTASIQAVVSSDATSDTVFQDIAYEIGGKTVRVGIVPAGSPPAFTTDATVAFDNTFSASLDVSDLAPGDYDVWTEACFATNCGRDSVPVTIG